jgi:sugar phosphate isomerase/epimerase
MKRRDFLRTTAIGAGVVGISPGLLKACSGSDPLHDFGIISGVISNELKVDAQDTLTQIAQMGYKYFEGGGSYGMSVPEFKDFMKGIGLKSIADGASMSNFQGDGLKKMIDDQLELGKKYLVCYWPWIKAPEEYTLEDMKEIVDELHKIGEECNKNGLRFAYHNHDHEFTVAAEGQAYDYILSNTDPDLLTMQMDLYWVSVGGADPVHYINKYPGRFELLHVKDAYDLKNRESFACVGEGVIDFERIFELRDVGGFKHLIVEKDGATEGIKCAQTSIKHLNSLIF